MGTYILGGSNTNDDTGVLNAQGDVNALSDVIVTNDLTVSGTADITGDSTLSNASLSGTLSVTGDSTLSNASLSGTLSVTGDSTLASTTATSLNVSNTLTSPNINASTSPLDLQVAGSTVATLDSSGDLTTNGWVYVKGKNRAYQQNLTATTTTSIDAVPLGLVKVSETVKLEAVVEAKVESPVTERVPESEAFERVESPVTERVPESEAFERVESPVILAIPLTVKSFVTITSANALTSPCAFNTPVSSFVLLPPKIYVPILLPHYIAFNIWIMLPDM